MVRVIGAMIRNPFIKYLKNLLMGQGGLGHLKNKKGLAGAKPKGNHLFTG
jgi:hypothetical protein